MDRASALRGCEAGTHDTAGYRPDGTDRVAPESPDEHRDPIVLLEHRLARVARCRFGESLAHARVRQEVINVVRRRD
jgi:hypothetical protein